MSNDIQTEETRPVPPGLDLRLRLLRRLADPNRNASWVFLALSLALATGLAISIYQALVYPVVNGAAWQLYLVAVSAGVLTGLSALAATLSRRVRPGYTIWLTLLSLQIGFVLCSLFVSGLGFWLALGVVMATLSITSLCLPATPVGADLRVRPASGFPSRPAFLPSMGVLAAFAVLAVDSYLTGLQIDPLPVFTYLVIAGAVLASLLFLGTLIAFFPTYSLRLKITITVFSASILSIALLSTLYNLTTRQALINAVDQTLLLASRQTARDIDAYFQQITDRLTAQAITPSLTLYLNLPPEERLPNSTTRTYLLTQRSLYGARYYALLDSQGYVVLHTQLVDTSQFPPYLGLPEAVTTAVQQTTSTGAIYLSPVLFPAPTTAQPAPYFIAAARVRDALGEQIGTLLAAFPLDSIQAIVAAANDTAGNGSYAILIDDNYLRLAHGRDPAALYQLLAPPDPPSQTQVDALIAAQRLPAQTDLDDPSEASDASIAPSYPDFVAGLQSLNQQPSFTSQDTFTGATLNAVAATRLNSRPWVLAFLQAQPAILAPVIAQTRLTLLLAVLVAGLAVLASTLLARLVADPIIRITSIAERAAAGNLYLQASAASADEIGALGLAFNSMINQLRHTLQGLETRVAERTAELAQASDQLQYRADHLQAVAELAHAIAAIQDPAELLPRLTHEISTRFGYYHTGIFLLNADQTYAVLEAANSAGGARMLARHHRLRVGQVGIVGYVAGTGQPRIALDVGQDAVFFDNPDLPDTRSEISLPLKIGEQIIGVLDVQSVQPAAFSQDDIALLSTLADQVAMAIQNTRLYAASLRTVHELQLAQRQYLQQMWSQIAAERSTVGYQLDFGRLQALPPASAPLAPALEPQQPGLLSRPGRLVVPLALRNQVIGLIDLQDVDPARAWTPQELAFARSVADQVALALENARLLEETRRRAERERLVSDITTRLRVSNDPQTILDTALSELRQALQVKSVQVRLQVRSTPPVSQPDHPTENTGEV